MSKELYVREWLNDDKGRAYIIIDASECEPDTKWYFTDCYVDIGDCSRSIQLDFSFDSEEKRLQRLDKVQALRAYMDQIIQFISSITVPPKEETKE